MIYNKIILTVLTAVLAVSLSVGCARKEEKHFDDVMDPTRVTSITSEKSFWASENLEMHYDSINKRVDALISTHKSTPYETRTEEVLGSVVVMLMSERIGNTPAPRTAADFWSQNFIPLMQLGSGWAQFFLTDQGDYNKSNSPNSRIQGDGNIVMFSSEVGTGPGNQADVYFGDYSPYDVTTNGEGSPLSFNASRPYTYSNQEDNSRTTTNTTTRTNESNNERTTQ